MVRRNSLRFSGQEWNVLSGQYIQRRKFQQKNFSFTFQSNIRHFYAAKDRAQEMRSVLSAWIQEIYAMYVCIYAHIVYLCACIRVSAHTYTICSTHMLVDVRLHD